MSIQNLKNAISSGLYRNHKFRILLNFPEFAGTSDDVTNASVLARSSKVPDSSVGVIEVPFEGRILPVPGDRVFEEFTVTLLNVNDFKVYEALERWSQATNGSESNTAQSLDISDLMRDITVELLDVQETVVKTYTLQDAFPTIVAGIDLDRASTDSTSEASVTFRYLQSITNTTR